MKIIKYLLYLAVLLFIASVLFETEIDSIRPSTTLPAGQTKEITRLALRALPSKDVPVGALVLYDSKIIGRGFNTVRRDNNLAGHAEINALNDAVATVGLEKFHKLDRGKLVVVTSFEPCEMCKGTMVHYNIRKIVVMKDKSLWHWWSRDLRSFWYELDKKQTGQGDLQDSLFMLHPDYNP